MIRKRRWQKSPVTGESTKETVKTIAQGRPGRSGEPVVTTLVCLFQFAREAAGATGTRLSLRPLFFEGLGFVHNSGAIRVAGWRLFVGTVSRTIPLSRSILRDAAHTPLPQDEVVRPGAKPDPHGEEAHRAVSNHEASDNCGPELEFRASACCASS